MFYNYHKDLELCYLRTKSNLVFNFGHTEWCIYLTYGKNLTISKINTSPVIGWLMLEKFSQPMTSEIVIPRHPYNIYINREMALTNHSPSRMLCLGYHLSSRLSLAYGYMLNSLIFAWSKQSIMPYPIHLPTEFVAIV